MEHIYSILVQLNEAKELLLVGVVVALYFLAFHKTTRFIAHCLFPDDTVVGYVKAFSRSINIMYISLGSGRFGEAFSLNSARLLVKMEILDPAPEQPAKSDFIKNKAGWKQALGKWKTGKKAQRKRVRDNLVMLLKLSKHDDSRPIVDVDVTTVAMEERRADIRRYFAELALINEDQSGFITRVRCEGGYMAPQFLLHGILSRFQDDWKIVIQNYQKQVNQTNPYSRELAEVRAFQFSCWLLWGPSIPMCQCDQWRAEVY
jgi:hypothetical protein